MKIIDCFSFYNELKMLDFRLIELYDVVDYFIIVEATYTHSGKSKELYFENNKNRYSKYMNKIIHIVVDDMPNTRNAWDNENYQRNCIDKGIRKLNLKDNDLIIISDCDEIPDQNTLRHIKEKGLDRVHCLKMDMYYYNLTCAALFLPWSASKILPYLNYKLANRSCEKIRHMTGEIINKGGWHFSYFGGVEFIKNKIRNFAHQEYNNAHFLDDKKIKTQIDNCDDLFFRNNIKFQKVNINDNEYLPHNYKLLLF